MTISERQAQRLESALLSIRKAAGSARHLTNRLQFIYERASVALAEEDWNDEWKAEFGYRIRSRLFLENEKLRAENAELRAQISEHR